MMHSQIRPKDFITKDAAVAQIIIVHRHFMHRKRDKLNDRLLPACTIIAFGAFINRVLEIRMYCLIMFH